MDTLAVVAQYVGPESAILKQSAFCNFAETESAGPEFHGRSENTF
jgi:hypothetical protein